MVGQIVVWDVLGWPGFGGIFGLNNLIRTGLISIICEPSQDLKRFSKKTGSNSARPQIPEASVRAPSEIQNPEGAYP